MTKPTLLSSKELSLAQDFGYVPSKCETLLESFLTVDSDLLIVKEKVKILSDSTCNTPVLILGETGTGKELIARALHGNRSGKFVDVNCAGIPDTLLESEFFGCVAGAYTGAITREGLLEQARMGTMFLDEIGDMPLLLQCKLLRVLQEKKARRLGTTQDYDVSCRFVSATNLNIGQIKKFRRDLYFRLAGAVLKLKPLRKRQLDFLEILKAKGLDDEQRRTFCLQHPLKEDDEDCFEGNVRELLNLIEEFKLEQRLKG